MIIDCAYDQQLTDDLAEYLKNKGFIVQKEGDSILKTNDSKLTKVDLEYYIMEKKKDHLQVIPVDEETIIIAAKVMIEHFGLARCSICGFVTYKEELFAHERAHGVHFL